MEILQPDTWAEALAAKAEHPEARPIAGGTDLMVELNFDRAPAARRSSTSTRVARADGVGAARTAGPHRRRRDLHARSSPSSATGCPGLAIASRTVGSPQIRNRGTVGGNLGTASPAGDALPPLLAAGAVVELASARGARRRSRSPSSSPAPKRNVLRARRADRRGPLAPAARAAAVRQGRHPQRDGDRGLLVRARARPATARASAPASARPAPTPMRAPRGRGVPRGRARRATGVGARGALPDAAVARFGELVAAAARADRRRARQRRLPPPRARRAGAADAALGAGPSYRRRPR